MVTIRGIYRGEGIGREGRRGKGIMVRGRRGSQQVNLVINMKD